MIYVLADALNIQQLIGVVYYSKYKLIERFMFLNLGRTSRQCIFRGS